MQHIPAGEPQILIDLSTAIIGADDGAFQCRMVDDGADMQASRLPFGPFVPEQHRTMEIGLRQWVTEQVGVDLGHVEQLYTFADRGRHDINAGAPHVVSVGYLALTNQANRQPPAWRDIYAFFPWEDWRDGEPAMLKSVMYPALDAWVCEKPERRERVRLAFGRDGLAWGEEYVLERYETLYEAGLIAEAVSDGRASALPATPIPGLALQLDHRRILATAIGRLRAKLKYRPVIFDLMPTTFTLTRLQHTAETVLGATLHKQNFRRLVEKSGFLEATGTMSQSRGRPAELFRFRHQEPSERPLAGLRVSPGRSRQAD